MKTPADVWELVIKVKFGETLRRFNVTVNRLDADYGMNKLRMKVIDLFKFDANANIILMYTDIDGDSVTLVDDDELHDAVFRQCLNPLRITVQMNTDFALRGEKRADVESSNDLPKVDSQSAQAPRIRSAIDDALRSVPDPLRSVLSIISHDFVSKAATSAPALGEFVEYFSRLGISHDSVTSSVPQNAQSTGASASIPVSQSTEDKQKTLHKIASGFSSSLNSDVVGQNLEDNIQLRGVSDKTERSVPSPPDVTMEILDCSYPKAQPSSASLTNDQAEGKEVANSQTDVKSIATLLHAVDQLPQHESQNGFTSMPASVAYPSGIADITGCGLKNIPCSASPSAPQFGFNPQGVPDKNNMDLTSNAIPSFGLTQDFSAYHRPLGHYNCTLRSFHRGVRCDGCGMHPIIGPRFKSNVKDDFDLCDICFSEMGNEADYTRIDRPAHAPHRTLRYLKEFNSHRARFRGPQGCPRYGLRPHKGKLESRFIQDVTVVDWTVMGPSTPFTKIWRMGNNGSVMWPAGTQLVWIGGDQLAERCSVDLEIAENGFPVDGVIDVAVDLRAPSRPGRYISYWRMASPSGQKFGQRVWVLIQVDVSRPNTSDGIIRPELNLNLPPEGVEHNGVGTIDVGILQPDSDSVKPKARETSDKSNLLVPLDPCGGGGSSPPFAEVPSSSSSLYPVIDLSNDPLPVPTAASEQPAPPPSEEAALGHGAVEQTLLKELEEMGFGQVDLNREVLRQNNYDLELALNDLCGMSEWDPILEELREMGFCDGEKNKKLLVKNGGSIKRVVLDLIAGERAELADTECAESIIAGERCL